MTHTLRTRILIGVALFLSILFLPWWLYCPAIIAAVILIPFYWEALVLAFLVQILYTPDGAGFFAFIPLVTFSLLLILIPLREELRL